MDRRPGMGSDRPNRRRAGCVVTIDALGCQKEIAQTIVERSGNDVPAVKENPPTLHRQVTELMDEAIGESFRWMRHDRHGETEGDHGCIETRRVWSTPDVPWLKGRGDWPGLQSLAAVESKREVGGQVSLERRCSISSLDGKDARSMAAAIRGHWGVENQLHWSLEVGFREDECRIRQGHGAENFSRIRRIALNLLKKETTAKAGIKGKRLKAGWNHAYLLKVLGL